MRACVCVEGTIFVRLIIGHLVFGGELEVNEKKEEEIVFCVFVALIRRLAIGSTDRHFDGHGSDPSDSVPGASSGLFAV